MTEPSFLPFSYPHPKQHPTLLMRKIPSHLQFPFPRVDPCWIKKPMYGRLYDNCVQTEATVRVNLLVPHLVHRKPLALPNTNTTFQQLLVTAIHATVLYYIWYMWHMLYIVFYRHYALLVKCFTCYRIFPNVMCKHEISCTMRCFLSVLHTLSHPSVTVAKEKSCRTSHPTWIPPLLT